MKNYVQEMWLRSKSGEETSAIVGPEQMVIKIRAAPMFWGEAIE